MSIAVLGPITFEVSSDKVLTWMEARRTATARWATHEVYAGKPKKEFLGPGLDKITMTVRLDITKGVVPRDEIRRMREEMNTGAVLQFTVGGELVGDFTIESVDDSWPRVSREGVVTTALVNLTIEEYV
jgi:phage protein U